MKGCAGFDGFYSCWYCGWCQGFLCRYGNTPYIINKASGGDGFLWVGAGPLDIMRRIGSLHYALGSCACISAGYFLGIMSFHEGEHSIGIAVCLVDMFLLRVLTSNNLSKTGSEI